MNPDYRKPFKVPKSRAEECIREALKLSYFVNVDELDCSKSFARQPTNKTVGEILEIGFKYKSTLYNFIYKDVAFVGEEPYYDVGFSTVGLKPEYFLWLKLTPENGQKLIEKYGM
jgi:hypothetical protein